MSFYLLILFFISSISSITMPDNQEKNLISIKVQSNLNKPTTYIHYLSSSLLSKIEMYFDGQKMPKFDKILPISDGNIHQVILKFPQNFKDSCENMFSDIKK